MDSLNASMAGLSQGPSSTSKMIVSSLINFESKEWDARLLEQYVDQEDTPMVQISEFGHKPYWSTGYLLLELHQKWSIYIHVWKLSSYKYTNIWPGKRSSRAQYNQTSSLCFESECTKKDLSSYLAIILRAGSGHKKSGTPQYITTAQDVESQKKLLLMRSSNAHRPYKHGHYHQHRQALEIFPISSIYTNMDYNLVGRLWMISYSEV